MQCFPARTGCTSSVARSEGGLAGEHVGGHLFHHPTQSASWTFQATIAVHKVQRPGLGDYLAVAQADPHLLQA
jgi:hypothetical protein